MNLQGSTQDARRRMPLCRTALWSLCLALAAAAAMIPAHAAAMDENTAKLGLWCMLIGTGLGVAALVTGHIAVPRTHRLKGQRGRPMAVTALITAYVILGLSPYTFLLITQVPEFRNEARTEEPRRADVPAEGRESMDQALGLMDQALVESRNHGLAFSCAEAAESLARAGISGVTVLPWGEGECLVKAKNTGDGPPLTSLWRFKP